MNEVPLSLDNLQQLDFGKIGAAFNGELSHVVKDCLDRPQDSKTRKVTITFLLGPVPGSDSMNRIIDCETVLGRLRSDLEFDGGPGIPVFRGLPFPNFRPV